MHWGHVRSKDLVTWEYLPAALAPDEPYDEAGVFSGTAMEADGKHILMYTGVTEHMGPDGKKVIRQNQCIAVGDGENYVKLSANPVITGDMLPAGCSREDFRDPKIWMENGVFYAAAANRAEDGSGQIALFTSGDGEKWSFHSMLDKCENRLGRMWECPDFFPLDGRQVLLLSPQDMMAQGLEFHGGNNAAFLLGDYDRETCRFSGGNRSERGLRPGFLRAPDLGGAGRPADSHRLDEILGRGSAFGRIPLERNDDLSKRTDPTGGKDFPEPRGGDLEILREGNRIPPCGTSGTEGI